MSARSASAEPTETSRLLVYDDSDRQPGGLRLTEKFWRDHSVWLLEQGYKLRPRFQLDWKPSWEGKDTFWWNYDDGLILSYSQLVDAIRITDGKSVMLKRVFKSAHPYEADLARLLSTEPLCSAPDNAVAPVFDILHSPHDSNADILVMPFLRSFADPKFDTIGEVVSFFDQIFRGVAFLHKHNIAHRDCNANNIMMNASPMYPISWHAVKTNYTPDLKRKAPHTTRTQTPVKYHLIDLGISRQYVNRADALMEPVIFGGDKSPPEHQGSNEFYSDPFPTDVYYLGNMVREHFIHKNLGFEFMEALVADMTKADPAARATMPEVVARFEHVRWNLSTNDLRSRVVARDEWAVMGFLRAIAHWSSRLVYTIRATPPIPYPPGEY